MSMYAEVHGSTLIQFPYTHGSLMAENPFTEFGNDPDLPSVFPTTDAALKNGYSLVEVETLPKPQINERTQKLEMLDPEPAGDFWFIGWRILSKTAEEIDADLQAQSSLVRAERNKRLSACDWTQLADAPGDKNAWLGYRQALRDVPSQAGFPWEIVWPQEP